MRATRGTDSSIHQYHFWSWHPTGANFAFLDGSVHLLSYNVDLATFNSLATRAAGEVPGEY